QMSHDVREHIATPVLDKLIKAVGEIQTQTFQVALFEFLHEFGGIPDPVAKSKALFCPIRDWNLAAIKLPAEAFVLALVGKFQQATPKHPLGRATEPTASQPSQDVGASGRMVERIQRACG